MSPPYVVAQRRAELVGNLLALWVILTFAAVFVDVVYWIAQGSPPVPPGKVLAVLLFLPLMLLGWRVYTLGGRYQRGHFWTVELKMVGSVLLVLFLALELYLWGGVQGSLPPP